MINLLNILGIVVGVVVGVLCARGAKGLGQEVALTRYTNTTSATGTIDWQVWLFGKVGLGSILTLLGAAATVIFLPSTVAPWAPTLGKVIGFLANIMLGFAAGVGGNVSGILSLPGVRDGIDCQIEMKRRTRRHLRRFLSVVLVSLTVVLCGIGPSLAGGGTWAIAVDRTASVEASQRDSAINALLEVALDRAHRFDITAIQVVQFDEQVMLSDMSWIPVPRVPVFEDCRKAKPSWVIEEGFITISPGLAEARKRQAVEACIKRQKAEHEAREGDERVFRERLRAALQAAPRDDVTTLIVPLVQWLVDRPGTRAVDVVTDCLDHSGIPPSSLKVPGDVEVTLIVARPAALKGNPRLDTVLEAVKAWSEVPGVTVVGVGEYAGLNQIAEVRGE